MYIDRLIYKSRLQIHILYNYLLFILWKPRLLWKLYHFESFNKKMKYRHCMNNVSHCIYIIITIIIHIVCYLQSLSRYLFYYMLLVGYTYIFCRYTEGVSTSNFCTSWELRLVVPIIFRVSIFFCFQDLKTSNYLLYEIKC